jgi:hypothetical protein
MVMPIQSFAGIDRKGSDRNCRGTVKEFLFRYSAHSQNHGHRGIDRRAQHGDSQPDRKNACFANTKSSDFHCCLLCFE